LTNIFGCQTRGEPVSKTDLLWAIKRLGQELKSVKHGILEKPGGFSTGAEGGFRNHLFFEERVR
jgi:hypothetical protein